MIREKCKNPIIVACLVNNRILMVFNNLLSCFWKQLISEGGKNFLNFFQTLQKSLQLSNFLKRRHTMILFFLAV